MLSARAGNGAIAYTDLAIDFASAARQLIVVAAFEAETLRNFAIINITFSFARRFRTNQRYDKNLLRDITLHIFQKCK